MDKILKIYDIDPPFLDAGGGLGYMSLHLAKKGFQGKLIDFSSDTIVLAKKNLKGYNIIVEKKNIFNEHKKYNFVLLLDVLEHVQEDRKLIDHIKKIIYKNGFFLITIPIRKQRWGADDILYGHIKRYELEELNFLFRDFEVKEIWDKTFPIFWVMQKLYRLSVKEPLGRANNEKITKQSALNMTKIMAFFNNYLSSKFIWQPLYHLNYLFRNNKKNDLFILLRKK